MIHRLGPPEPAASPLPRTYSPVMETSDANNLQVIQRERMDALRVKYWRGLIYATGFALGVVAIWLSVCFALIYSFLRWVLA